MTGWVKLRHVDTAYHRKASTDTYPLADWPPRFWKFALKTDGPDPVEVAFVDSRRFARVRLIDCEGDKIRTIPPLNANGPDPVIDRAIVTEPWLRAAVSSRRVPIKALLLDQAFLSGVGNWVGDEVLYQASIHPEQPANSLTRAEVGRLYTALHDVTGHAVRVLADWERYGDDWLFLFRWSKGQKDSAKRLPNGSRITFITVGGRTSAVVADRQKLRRKAPKAEEDEEDPVEIDGALDPKDEVVGDGVATVEVVAGKGRKRKQSPAGRIQKAGTTPTTNGNIEDAGNKRKGKPKDDHVKADVVPPATKRSKSKKEDARAGETGEVTVRSRVKATTKKSRAKTGVTVEKNEAPSRRRSARLNG